MFLNVPAPSICFFPVVVTCLVCRLLLMGPRFRREHMVSSPHGRHLASTKDICWPYHLAGMSYINVDYAHSIANPPQVSVPSSQLDCPCVGTSGVAADFCVHQGHLYEVPRTRQINVSVRFGVTNSGATLARFLMGAK